MGKTFTRERLIIQLVLAGKTALKKNTTLFVESSTDSYSICCFTNTKTVIFVFLSSCFFLRKLFFYKLITLIFRYLTLSDSNVGSFCFNSIVIVK